jgi:hypothetical protein
MFKRSFDSAVCLTAKNYEKLKAFEKSEKHQELKQVGVGWLDFLFPLSR